MALTSTGPLSFSDLQTHFVAGSGTTSLANYYRATNGIPTSGTISMQNFLGKSRLGLGVTSVSTSFDMFSSGGVIIRVTGNGSVGGGLNFRPTVSDGNNILYHFNVRPAESTLVQNTLLNGAWGTEERLSYSTIGLSAGANFTLFLVMTSSGFQIQGPSRNVIYTFNNRYPSTACYGFEWGGYSTVERVLI